MDSAVNRRMALAPMRTALALTFALLLTANGASASTAAADNVDSHESTWRVEDLGLYMDKSILGLPGGGDAIVNALELWQRANSRLPRVWPIIGEVDDVGYRSGQSNRNTIRYTAGGEPRAKGALAITVVTFDSQKATIDDADIIVNGAYSFDDNGQYVGLKGSDSAHNAYDIGDVLAHEMGHFFGLPDNPDDNTAIMYPLFDAGVTRRKTLSDTDTQALDDLYSSTGSNPTNSGSCSVARVPHQFPRGWAGLGWTALGMALLLQKIRRNTDKARRPRIVKST